ncbi:uncharacterized protein LOC131934912 [Physella acuta]|uniref:uncharacterized protein LOC131934912 n=1 Tax=Physella acuta TaxID=109671 RepID=UPI0027DC96FA|nr:uncharacterized protein LOC131934912 [Physella acuta]
MACGCVLSSFIFSNDLTTISNILESCVWKRFSVSSDNETIPSESFHFQTTHDSDPDSYSKYGFEDKKISVMRQRYGTKDSFLIYLKNKGFMVHEDDKEMNSCRFDEKLTCPHPTITVSAVFTGCPLLLGYFLYLHEEPEKEKQSGSVTGTDANLALVGDTSQVLSGPACRTQSHHTQHTKNLDFTDTPHTNNEDFTETPHTKNLDFTDTPHTNNEDFTETPHTKNEDFTETPHTKNEDFTDTPHTKNEDFPNTPHKKNEDLDDTQHTKNKDFTDTQHTKNGDVASTKTLRQELNRLVDIRVACEFPLTDTWIHQFVNLVVSPLHLACWRHDVTAIQTLLQHGADPDKLALEQATEFHHTEDGKLYAQSRDNLYYTDGFLFHRSRGLSPLHFVALGLRSPPRESVMPGKKVGIIHDVSACLFRHFATDKTRSDASLNLGPDSNLSPIYNCGASVTSCVVSYLDCNSSPIYNLGALVPISEVTYPENNSTSLCNFVASGKHKDLTQVKVMLTQACITALIKAGANPNSPDNNTFHGAHPLDLIIQPPMRIYYAPYAARQAQNSESLRIQNMNQKAPMIIAAADMLLFYNACLSESFCLQYQWRPQLLNGFHLKDLESSIEMVKIFIKAGLFPNISLKNSCKLCSNKYCTDNPDQQSEELVKHFIADVINTSVPLMLVSLVLKWCDVCTLHTILRGIQTPVDSSGQKSSLEDFSRFLISLQMRSLQHSCAHQIARCADWNTQALLSLPLPLVIKQNIIHLNY